MKPTPADNDAGVELLRVARWSVETALRGDYLRPPLARIGLLAQRRGVFVTVYKMPKELRGCIGSLDPQCSTVLEETWRLARQAALADSRFAPITASELSQCRFKVSVLHSLIAVASAAELQPTRYGVVVRTKDGRHGALLPALAEVDTAEEQLRVARQKGGIHQSEPIQIERFAVDVFEE